MSHRQSHLFLDARRTKKMASPGGSAAGDSSTSTSLLLLLMLVLTAQAVSSGRLLPPPSAAAAVTKLLTGEQTTTTTGGHDRIVGGQETAIADVPYQVLLIIDGVYQCGGALLTYSVALTAAHCTTILPVNVIYVHAGSSSSSLSQSPRLRRLVVRTAVHPKFDKDTLDYDVSLVWVLLPFASGTPNIRPIELVTQRPRVGDLGQVSGWGALVENGTAPVSLMSVEVPKVDQALCVQDYKEVNPITPRMTCYGYASGGRDACQGDSGGPLAVGGKLAGTVSFGVGCAVAKYPGVYADLCDPEIRSFVNQNAGLRSTCSPVRRKVFHAFLRPRP